VLLKGVGMGYIEHIMANVFLTTLDPMQDQLLITVVVGEMDMGVYAVIANS
jgi:hypothetical protein